ncbi:hypothetical protein KEM52_003569 [Ascosphaera acerosa]|nr:hypothetical protein KEM52_003569 [Ascosphaera acerosa]
MLPQPTSLLPSDSDGNQQSTASSPSKDAPFAARSLGTHQALPQPHPWASPSLNPTAAAAASSSSLHSRRRQIPPALKFEGVVLPDIGEEDDTKLRTGASKAGPTSGATDASLRTPQFSDDAASATFTGDDESEYASGTDLGSQAERRLERAKRRLTDMGETLSLAHSTVTTPRHAGDDDNDGPAPADSTNPLQRRDAPGREPHHPGREAYPSSGSPLNDFLLPYYASAGLEHASSTESFGALGSYRAISPVKFGPRTSSLPGASARQLPLPPAQRESLSNGHSPRSPYTAISSPGLSPVSGFNASQPDLVAATLPERSQTAASYTSHEYVTDRASTAASLRSPPLYSRGKYSQSLPLRSRSAMTAYRTGEEPMANALPMSYMPRKQYSFSTNASIESASLPRRYRQQWHTQRVHTAISAPTLSSRYRQSRRQSTGDWQRASSAPTDRAAREEQVRELKDQVTSLKIKISSLKVRTQADSLRRRKSEHASKQAGHASERPSLFTDARQTDNDNGYMTRSQYVPSRQPSRGTYSARLNGIIASVSKRPPRRPTLNGIFPDSSPASTTRDSSPDKLAPVQEGPSEGTEAGTNAKGLATLSNAIEQSRNEIGVNVDLANPASDSDMTTGGSTSLSKSSDSDQESTALAEQLRVLSNDTAQQHASPADVATDAFGTAEPPELRAATRHSDPTRPTASRVQDLRRHKASSIKRAASAAEFGSHRRVTWSDDFTTSQQRDEIRLASTSISTDLRGKLSPHDHQTTAPLNSARSFDEQSSPATTPHELREDAFDYQHFLLSSAMASDYANPSDTDSLLATDDDCDDQTGELTEPDSATTSSAATPMATELTGPEIRQPDGPSSPSNDLAVSSEPQLQQTEAAPSGDYLAPPTGVTMPFRASQESLSTVMTYETASEGRNSSNGSEASDAISIPQNRSRQNSGKAPFEGASSTGSLRYKFSAIRNASSPTVLIQPQLLQPRAAESPRSTSELQGTVIPEAKTTSRPNSELGLQDVVSSLIMTAARRYAPPSVVSPTISAQDGVAPSSEDQTSSSLTQLQDQDMARLSSLFTSIGQLALRLQLSLAEQQHSPDESQPSTPRTPSTVKGAGSIHSHTASARAAQVLRDRLEAAKRVLDGKLEIPAAHT